MSYSNYESEDNSLAKSRDDAYIKKVLENIAVGDIDTVKIVK